MPASDSPAVSFQSSSVEDLVDAHAHFWDPGRMPYAWLAEVPPVAGRHLPADLHSEMGATVPRQLVFVAAGCDTPMEEVAWVETLAADDPRIAAIVAFTPVDRGAETAAAIAGLARRPLVRGVRHLIQSEPDPAFCLRPEFVDGVRALGEAGLSFDLCIRHHQLPAVIELCRRAPGTTFILDHAGKPDIRNHKVAPWHDDIARLAALPNVTCKLSGLIYEANREEWTVEDLRPYADRVLSVFGAERVAFGSDWPVVKMGSSYTGWLRAALALTQHLSPAARAAVFADNCRRIYRLKPVLPA